MSKFLFAYLWTTTPLENEQYHVPISTAAGDRYPNITKKYDFVNATNMARVRTILSLR